jgi:DNA invertase Pin-like site-specific DNA recombinase
MLIGYAFRGSFRDPYDTQVAQIQALGCDRIEVEEDDVPASRLALQACLASMTSGQTLAVVRLALLAPDMSGMLGVMHSIATRGAHLRSLAEELDTRDASQGLFHLAEGFSRFLEDAKLERMLAGRQQARVRGERLGRKPKLTVDQIEHGRKLLQMGEGGRAVAKTLGISEATLYRRVRSTAG